jgi:predicted permease
MIFLHRLRSIVHWMFRRTWAEQQLDDELRTFIELSAADRIRAGVAPDEAHRLAQIELGGVEQVKERVRTHRHGAWLDEAARDLRYAFRMVRKNPGFTGVVVLTLALGIGANTAIFSLIDALMLRWLPVRDPGELVQIVEPKPGGGGNESYSYAFVGAVAGHREIFSGVAGFSPYRFNVLVGDSVRRVPGALVTGEFYDTLGLAPAAGRLLGPADDREGAPLAAVISYGYWQREYSGSRDAIGRILTISGVPVAIVGVSPSGFTSATVGTAANITMSAASVAAISETDAALLGKGNFWLRVLARPVAGMSHAEVSARLNTLWPQIWDSVISERWPEQRRREFAAMKLAAVPGGTGWTWMRDTYQKPLMVLMGVVSLVLLIACANVASLMLARASARQRELAIRLAIGAGRGRIIRQLLTECLVLSLAGAIAGVFLAWAFGRLLVSVISTPWFRVVVDLTPNWHVLAFTGAIGALTGVLFGTAPAFQVAPAAQPRILRDDARTTGARSRTMSVLVSAQVALSILLLVAAGLFARTLRNLQTLDPGFNHEGVLVVELPEHRAAVPMEWIDEARAIPGVTSASLSTHTPLSGSIWSEPAVPAGQPLPQQDTAVFVGAGPGFFETMQMRLLEGREFSRIDAVGAAAVAIVNESYARRYFSNRSPVGQRLSAVVRGERKDLQIVGLASNTKATGLRRTPAAIVYVPYQQLSGNVPTSFEVRASGSLTQAATALQRMLQPRFPNAPIEVVPLSAQVDGAMMQERLMATVASGFGGLALLLACVGIYGLLAYTVARRAKEMGIRLALGAQRRRLIAMVLTGALRLVAVGVALGVPSAWAATRLVKSMLFGLEPTDPATLAAAVGLLSAAALIAAYVPAWRASRVDPLVALRHD